MSKVLYVIWGLLTWASVVVAQDTHVNLVLGKQMNVLTDVDPELESYYWPDHEGYWDYSSLTFEQKQSFRIKDARKGTSIPVIGHADFVLESGSLEVYYTYDENRLLLQGTTDVELLYNKDMHNHVMIFDGLVDYDPDVYQDKTVRSSAIGTVELYSDDLPTEVTSTWDELNYRYVLEQAIDQVMTLGRKGKLVLSDGTFSVTQIIIERTINQRILAKDVEFAHADINIESALSSTIYEKEIRYYSDGRILPLLKMNIDPQSEEVLSIQYLSNENYSPRRKHSGQEGMTIQPNPTFGKSDLFVEVHSPGKYAIHVKNILGRTIYKEEVEVNRELNVPVNLMFLRKGSYFCSLVDESGRTIVTKKLVILKP